MVDDVKAAAAGLLRALVDDNLVAELDGSSDPLLLLGHTDTVWPLGTLESMPFRVEEGVAYGPGTYDMKAGQVVLVEAVRRAGPGRRQLRIFLTAEEELAINVGAVRGGTEANVVAAHAEAMVDARLTTAADSARLDEELARLRPVLDGTSLQVDGEYSRPPLERTEAAGVLFTRAREHGRALGLDLAEATSGGGSDANLVSAHGVPVLVDLGAAGGGADATSEHVHLASIPERAALLARVLEDPGL